MLASALANRPLQVAACAPGQAAWTDGKVVFVDAAQSHHEQLRALAVQASLLSAGSLTGEIAAALVRRPALAKRYLAVEGARALSVAAPLLPPSLQSLVARSLSDSPSASLELARSRQPLPEAPASFGTIHARQLLARGEQGTTASAPAQPKTLVELAEDPSTDAPAQQSFVGELGGGGAIGKWLSKMLTAVRQLGGGGSPGADAPTHWTRGKRRGSRATLMSTASTGAVEDSRAQKTHGTKYPEWDVHAQRYRMDWCTVSEVELQPGEARFPIADRNSLRRALTRLGLGIDRYHRQAQGDDIDIDAVIESRIELLAGS
ncbi:MAG: nitric oxide reductase activation protein, partial [Polyangiales bacterium]